jgi:hypothetical protein
VKTIDRAKMLAVLAWGLGSSACVADIEEGDVAHVAETAEVSLDEGAEPVSKATPLPAANNGWAIVAPGQFQTCVDGQGFAAFHCSGTRCTFAGGLCVPLGSWNIQSWWTTTFSEEDPYSFADCGGNPVTGIQCDGQHCDNVRVRCSRMPGVAGRDCYWSEEVADRSEVWLAERQFIGGVACEGRFCTRMRPLVCSW